MKWKRTIGWALAGVLVLLLIAAVGGYFYLRSNNFQQFALSKIVEQADAATGGRAEIGGLDFDLSTLISTTLLCAAPKARISRHFSTLTNSPFESRSYRLYVGKLGCENFSSIIPLFICR
jgi:hypothetical protein